MMGKVTIDDVVFVRPTDDGFKKRGMAFIERLRQINKNYGTYDEKRERMYKQFEKATKGEDVELTFEEDEEE